MAKYMIDDVRVDTSKAKREWSEDTRWDGRNHISVNTGSQWEHETLYLSAKGRYYIESVSAWQGSVPSAAFITPEEAARWLLANSEPLPEDLAQYEDAMTE